MTTINIPDGKIILRSHPFTLDAVKKIMRKLCDEKHRFSGFVDIKSGDDLYLLFFLNGRPNAAGKLIGNKPAPLPIREFFREAGQLVNSGATITIHSSDPVLLKCLLIFIQNSPTAMAPTDLINLDSILLQIQRDAIDALIVLESRGDFNYFFFKNGTRGMSYYSDSDYSIEDGVPIDEQMLTYAFQLNAQVNAMVYCSTETHEDPEGLTIDVEEMLQLLQWGWNTDSDRDLQVVHEKDLIQESLVLSVLEGAAQQGQTLSGPIPCILGRKDCDIILNDPLVSNQHAAILLVVGSLMLVDLNSSNGTRHNGKSITRQIIVPGDIIAMGDTNMKIISITPP